MHVLVCLKWVALRPEVDPLSGEVATDERFSGPSPADRSALEWALRLSGIDDEVSVVSVGPPAAEAMLRDALAVGAVDAIRVDQDGDAPSSVVAAAIKALIDDRGDVELVCTGDYSLDRGSGSVPGFLANQLGWSQALGLVSAERRRGGLMVERRLDHGRRERLHVTGPAVVSFERGPDLRRAPLAAALAASTAMVRARELDDDGEGGATQGVADRPRVIARGPYRPPANVKPAPTGSTGDRLLALSGAGAGPGADTARFHDVPAAEAARLAAAQLQEWGYLDQPDDGDDVTPS